MEEKPQSTALEGEIVGIRFGLATHREICAASVSECPITHSTQLTNPFLGLPLEFVKCESCGTSELKECEGHFGYIELPIPIYHPSHVNELKSLLSFLCLKCLKLKSNKVQRKHSGMAEQMLSCCEEASQVSIKDIKTADGACLLQLKLPALSKPRDGVWNFLERYGFRYGYGHTRTLLPCETGTEKPTFEESAELDSVEQADAIWDVGTAKEQSFGWGAAATRTQEESGKSGWDSFSKHTKKKPEVDKQDSEWSVDISKLREEPDHQQSSGWEAATTWGGVSKEDGGALADVGTAKEQSFGWGAAATRTQEESGNFGWDNYSKQTKKKPEVDKPDSEWSVDKFKLQEEPDHQQSSRWEAAAPWRGVSKEDGGALVDERPFQNDGHSNSWGSSGLKKNQSGGSGGWANNRSEGSRGWGAISRDDGAVADEKTSQDERTHGWGSPDFKKSQAEGSRGWGKTPDWKPKKNYPPKSPGIGNEEFSMGPMFTATRHRVGMFSAEEQDILAVVEPLMLSIRRILHNTGYNDGDPLSVDDQSFIVESVFSYHPDKAAKMGAGIDHITVSKHTSFQDSRCFFVVSTDGSRQDFSYRKCVENYVKEKFPNLAEEFNGKYFAKRTGVGNRQRRPESPSILASIPETPGDGNTPFP